MLGELGFSNCGFAISNGFFLKFNASHNGQVLWLVMVPKLFLKSGCAKLATLWHFSFNHGPAFVSRYSSRSASKWGCEVVGSYQCSQDDSALCCGIFGLSRCRFGVSNGQWHTSPIQHLLGCAENVCWWPFWSLESFLQAMCLSWLILARISTPKVCTRPGNLCPKLL